MRGKGYGKQLLRLAIDYAQRELGTSRISLGVFATISPPSNATSQSVSAS